MTTGRSARRPGSRPNDKANSPQAGEDHAPDPKANDRSSTRGSANDFGESLVAALGAPVEGARNEAKEIERLRRQGAEPDSQGGTGTVPLDALAPETAKRRRQRKSGQH